jgi:hypothetical protein
MLRVTQLIGAFLSNLLLVFFAPSWAQNEASGPPGLPPSRPIPGITTEDLFPNGCVDCHINYTDMNLDTRLSTILARWSEAVEPAVLDAARGIAGPDIALTGVHPRVDQVLVDIPAACFGCHQDGAKGVVPLVPLLHKLHLGGGNEGVFLRLFQGECTHCHKLDKASGRWQVPSARER